MLASRSISSQWHNYTWGRGGSCLLHNPYSSLTKMISIWPSLRLQIDKRLVLSPRYIYLIPSFCGIWVRPNNLLKFSGNGMPPDPLGFVHSTLSSWCWINQKFLPTFCHASIALIFLTSLLGLKIWVIPWHWDISIPDERQGSSVHHYFLYWLLHIMAR